MKKNYLREIRTGKGVSGLELARRSKIAPSTISNIENYRIVPYDGWKQRISEALGVPVEEIFPNEGV